MSDDPQFFIRPPGGNFHQVTEEKLLAAGPGHAASCGAECSEGHTYEGRCAQSTGNACVWPDCLSDGQQAELAAQITAIVQGDETVPGPNQPVICGCDEAPGPDAASQSRTTPDSPVSSGDAADNSGSPLQRIADAADRIDAGVRAAAETAARSVAKALSATRETFTLTGQVQPSGPNLEFEAENASQVEDDELTAEEARALAEQLGFELYQAQDAVAFVEECCVIADREGLPVTTALVREWLQGPKCARQMAAGVPALPDRAQAVTRQQQVAVRDRQLAAIRALLADPDNRWAIEPGDLRAALDVGEATP